MSNQKSVIIIEDDLVSALLIGRILHYCKYKVLNIHKNGTEAIKSILLCKPDLIVSDIDLEGSITGIDVINEISYLCDSRVIFTTANDDEDVIEKALQTNPLGVLKKPVKKIDLVNLVLGVNRCHY